MIDTVITNARIVSPREIVRGGIAIHGGKIVNLGGEEPLPAAREVIDAEDSYVIPGLVDPHLHYGLVGDEPISERVKRDWSADAVGALHGGVTTVMPMLMSRGSYLPMVRELIAWGEEESPADFGFTAIVHREEHLEELPGLFGLGLTSYKHFFTAFKGAEGEQISLNAVDEGMLFRSLEIIRDLGAPAIAMVHAEDSDLYSIFIERERRKGRDGLEAWADARPQFTEYTRVEFAAALAQAAGAPLYFVHLSTAESVDIVGKYKASGAMVHAEAVVHTLTVSRHDREVGVWGKFVPPLRGERDIDALWSGLRSGVLDTIASDHCTYLLEEKEMGQGKHGSIWDVPPGISNVQEHWLPVLWTHGVEKGRITVQDLVRLCCENSARLFGLYPRKGVIAPGADADLVIVDDETVHEVTPEFYHGRDGRLSIHMGQKLTGRPRLTMLGGRTVVSGGEYRGSPGDGRYVPSRIAV